MSSEHQQLAYLLKHLEPVLHHGEYVFCVQPKDISLPTEVLLMVFQEAEGTTIVLQKEQADAHGLHYDFCSAWITLQVQSSLSAVGLTSAFSTALAQSGISCNVVAAFHHDHLFVPTEQADEALQILWALSSSAE